MTETQRDRALFAARLRALPGKDRTLLTSEAIDDICAEYLRLEALVSTYGAHAVAMARAAGRDAP